MDIIKCACAHSFENNRKVCEIDYGFIVEKPLLTECGHYVCKQCAAKIETQNLQCETCKSENKKSILKADKHQNPGVQALLNRIIDMSIDELEKSLDEKTARIQSCIDKQESGISKLRHNLKNEIGLRAEIVKKQIDVFRETMFKEVDRKCDALISETATIDKSFAESHDEKYSRKKEFFQKQEHFSHLVEKLDKLTSELKMVFKPSQFELKRDHFGELEFSSMTRYYHHNVELSPIFNDTTHKTSFKALIKNRPVNYLANIGVNEDEEKRKKLDEMAAKQRQRELEVEKKLSSDAEIGSWRREQLERTIASPKQLKLKELPSKNVEEPLTRRIASKPKPKNPFLSSASQRNIYSSKEDDFDIFDLSDYSD